MKKLALTIFLALAMGIATPLWAKEDPLHGTSHYDFFGKSKKFEEVGEYLEKFYTKLRKIMPYGSLQKKFVITVFDKKGDFEGRTSSTQLVMSDKKVAHLTKSGEVIVTTDAPRYLYYIELFYQCTRQYLGRLYPQCPVWLGEGLCEYFSAVIINFRLEKLELGVDRYKHLLLLKKAQEKNKLPILVDFFDLEQRRFVAGKSGSLNQAFSWLICHYLIEKKKSRMRKLLRYVFLKRRLYYIPILGRYSKFDKNLGRYLDQRYLRMGEKEYLKGKQAYGEKKWYPAIRAFSQVLVRHPHHAVARYLRAMCHYNRKSYDAALKDFDYLVEMGLDNHLPYYYRAVIFDMRGYPKKALENLDKAHNIAPGDKRVNQLRNKLRKPGKK